MLNMYLYLLGQMQKIKDALSKSFVVVLDERDAEQLDRLNEESGDGDKNQDASSPATNVASKKLLNNQVVKVKFA